MPVAIPAMAMPRRGVALRQPGYQIPDRLLEERMLRARCPGTRLHAPTVRFAFGHFWFLFWRRGAPLHPSALPIQHTFFLLFSFSLLLALYALGSSTGDGDGRCATCCQHVTPGNWRRSTGQYRTLHAVRRVPFGRVVAHRSSSATHCHQQHRCRLMICPMSSTAIFAFSALVCWFGINVGRTHTTL